MIGVAICGAGGRMGDHVLRAVEDAPEMQVVGALECPDHARLGQEDEEPVRGSANKCHWVVCSRDSD